MRKAVFLGVTAVCLSVAGAAGAVDFPRSINDRPAGPGTERPGAPRPYRVTPGVQADVSLGSGFSDTYGLGVDGRVGYAMANGIYVGGAASYFGGRSIQNQSAHAAFIGGELGYKIFPTRDARWEIRPYVFAGPAFVTTVSDVPLTESKTSLAVQPGVLGAYHFGDAFLQVDARYFMTPTPTTLAIFAGAGLAF